GRPPSLLANQSHTRRSLASPHPCSRLRASKVSLTLLRGPCVASRLLPEFLAVASSRSASGNPPGVMLLMGLGRACAHTGCSASALCSSSPWSVVGALGPPARCRCG